MAEIVRVRKGDLLKITYQGRTIDARLVLASDNCWSLAFEFDGFLGGYLGVMPVLWKPEKQHYIDLLAGKEVTITYDH
jgi:hypothetical protein